MMMVDNDGAVGRGWRTRTKGGVGGRGEGRGGALEEEDEEGY